MLRLVFLGKFRPLAPSVLDAAAPPGSIATLEELRNWVAEQAPALGAALAATPFKLIVNHAVVHDLSARFRAGDEIAFMPPMSGG
jgi:molybdopterin converting factor small subunit